MVSDTRSVNRELRIKLRREEVVIPLLKIAKEKQSKLKPKVIPKSVFDRTLRKIPVTDRDKIAAWEEDKDYYSENKQIVLRMSYMWYPYLYHLTTKVLPLAIFIWYTNGIYSY